MKKGRLILIVGPSGSGKTVLANSIIRNGVSFLNDETLPSNIYEYDSNYYEELAKITTNFENDYFYARKYLTREPRKEDIGIIHASKEEMETKCNIIMPGYKDGDFVGLNTNEIISQIDKGKHPVLVTGIMGVAQEVVKEFYERNRLDDIYLVGIYAFLKKSSEYVKLEKGRYQGSIKETNAIESAQKRSSESRLFARQFNEFFPMFDYIFDNLRLKYAHDPDHKKEASCICSLSESNLPLDRNEEQKRKLMEFISCNLEKFEPVKDEEIIVI